MFLCCILLWRSAPLAFLIVYALKTRKMADAMVLATLLAVLLVHRQHFFHWADRRHVYYTGQQLLSVCTVQYFGLWRNDLAVSGLRRAHGLPDLLAKAANTPRKTLLLAWLLSVIMFVDEYLNAPDYHHLPAGVSDKTVCPGAPGGADQHYGMLPVRDGALYQLDGIQRGPISDFGLGFTDYLQAVPFMFYPLAMMLVSLLLALGWFPKVGMLRQAYHRVASGGAAFEPGEKDEAGGH